MSMLPLFRRSHPHMFVCTAVRLLLFALLSLATRSRDTSGFTQGGYHVSRHHFAATVIPSDIERRCLERDWKEHQTVSGKLLMKRYPPRGSDDGAETQDEKLRKLMKRFTAKLVRCPRTMVLQRRWDVCSYSARVADMRPGVPRPVSDVQRVVLGTQALAILWVL